jgi:GNAT superfamily N-acetyltransferase
VIYLSVKIISKDKIPDQLIDEYIKETSALKKNINLADFKLILHENGKAVGFVTGNKGQSKDGKVIVLNNLFVLKDYRRKKYARKLLYNMASISRKKSYVGLDFEVTLEKTQKLLEKEKLKHENWSRKKGKTIALFRTNTNANSKIDHQIRFAPRIQKKQNINHRKP